MAIAVGVTPTPVFGSAVTSVTTAGVTSAASGSTFLIGYAFSTGSTFSSVSDSRSNSYTRCGAEVLTPGASNNGFFFKINGAGGASHTFTVTWTTSNNGEIWSAEITGADTAANDGTATSVNDAATPFASNNISTTNAADMLVGFTSTDSASNPGTFTYNNAAGNPTTGWAKAGTAEELNGATNFTGAIFFVVVAATSTTYHFTITELGAANAGCHMIALKEAGSGGSSEADRPAGTGAPGDFNDWGRKYGAWPRW